MACPLPRLLVGHAAPWTTRHRSPETSPSERSNSAVRCLWRPLRRSLTNGEGHMVRSRGFAWLEGLRQASQPAAQAVADVNARTPRLEARFWRTRRSAAIAGIVFAILLLTALTMLRLALSADSLQSLESDAARRRLIRISLQLVPFAGIAFLWFIGVVRDQLGDVEDRLFSTVFLGSGLLFLAMLFVGAVNASSMTAMLRDRTSTPTSGRSAAPALRGSFPSTPCAWPQCSPSR